MGILDTFKLTGKKAFITGGAQGIGKVIATAFAEAGADVAIADLNEAGAKKTAEEISRLTGQKLIGIKTDVTSPEDIQNMLKEILTAFGSIDIAVCNAGININEPAETMAYETWRRILDINLTGVFLSAQAAGKTMIDQCRGGSIVMMGSISGQIVNLPMPQCAYNASKAGVVHLAKSMAVEWARHHIRVNSISPGYTATEMTLKAPWIAEWNALTPMRRMGLPEELAGAALYLASDASAYTTGANIVVDGGLTCI